MFLVVILNSKCLIQNYAVNLGVGRNYMIDNIIEFTFLILNSLCLVNIYLLYKLNPLNNTDCNIKRIKLYRLNIYAIIMYILYPLVLILKYIFKYNIILNILDLYSAVIYAVFNFIIFIKCISITKKIKIRIIDKNVLYIFAFIMICDILLYTLHCKYYKVKGVKDFFADPIMFIIWINIQFFTPVVSAVALFALYRKHKKLNSYNKK